VGAGLVCRELEGRAARAGLWDPGLGQAEGDHLVCRSLRDEQGRRPGPVRHVLGETVGQWPVVGWYAQDRLACSKGTTWLNVHEVVGNDVNQLQGLKVADEPVTSPVVAGGKVLIVGSDGVLDLSGDISASFSTGLSTPIPGVGAGSFEMLGWMEVQ